MAKQLGHVKYKGTIGEIRHFKIKGMTGNFAGLKGGATGEQIKNDAAFVRTRENMSEFAGCATVGKAIRTGQAQLMKQMSDPQFTGRLTAIVKKINLEDQSEVRGQRAILISAAPQYLLGLNFNRNIVLESTFNGLFNTSVNSTANEVILSVAGFDPKSRVNAPAGATHFRFVNSISVISDYVFNPTTNIYEPMNVELNTLSKVTYSNYIDLKGGEQNELEVLSTLPGSPYLTSSTSLLSCVGIEFYQKVGTNYYILSVGNCMKIKNIFQPQLD